MVRRILLTTPAVRECVAAHRDRHVADARRCSRSAEVWLRTADWADRYRDGLGDGYRRNAAELYRQAGESRGAAARAQHDLDTDSPARAGASA